MAKNELTKKKVNKIWSEAQTGSLTKLGYPNYEKLLSSARKDRAKVMRKLNWLANASGDDATKARARSLVNRLKVALDKEG